MKALILALSIISLGSLSSVARAEDLNNDEAYELIKINQSFGEKKILMTPSLCSYQNELIQKAKPKYKLDPLACPRNEGSQTKDEELSTQLQEIKSLETLTANKNDLDPESQDLLEQMIINLPSRRK